MTIKIQVLLIAFLLVLLIVIINMLRKRDLELKYVLVWMACDIALIILTCFPQLMRSLASALGIYSPMNMIFFLGFVFSLIIIFSLTVALSRVTEKVRKIAQIVAMLPDELKEDIMKDKN